MARMKKKIPLMSSGSGTTYAPSGNVISTAGWVGYLLVMAIPIIGLIIYIVWAFGSGANPNVRNFARATLILMLIAIAFSLLFGLVFGGLYASLLGMLF